MIAATSRAEGKARTTPSKGPDCPNLPSTSGTPTAAVTGVKIRSSGVILALYTPLTYFLRSIEVVFMIHRRSFSSHPPALPEPEEPMRNRMNRKDVGEDWKLPAKE